MLTIRIAEQTLEIPTRFKYILEPVITVANDVGAHLYIFGGFLRDLISNEMPGDADIYVNGVSSTEFSHELHKHGIIDLQKDYIGEIPFKEDIMLFLSQAKVNGFDFDFVSTNKPSIAEYITRSDFTVNTLYYDLQYKKLVDPTGHGVKDIQAKFLRANSESITPLEALRAVKLSVLHGYTIGDDVVLLIRKVSPEIALVGDGMLIKILGKAYAQNPVQTDGLLTKLGILQYIPDIIREAIH